MDQSTPQTEKMLYVQVWEAPVRITHWILVLALLCLGITGYLIGNPPFSAPGEASFVYTFGTIRFIHFLAGYVLLASFLLRVYWGFVGNRFCRWTTMLPFTRRRWLGLREEVECLLFPKGNFPVFTGHAPLANVSYLVLYLGVLFSITSGFTLYAQGQYSPFWRSIGPWGLALFGNNLNTVHFLHHLALWFFAVFAVIHLYLVIYTILMSRTTEVDAMISGKKFVLEEDLSPYSD